LNIAINARIAKIAEIEKPKTFETQRKGVNRGRLGDLKKPNRMQ
jgi:hypothetical protein